ncbi:MAG: hypothetical protein KDA93_10865 [Planctomycetaceae bacterium]|nr:hypothetical protein [Planctomycetaceae bacterium]
MKSTQLLAAVVVLASFAQVSDAGLFNKYFGHDTTKCCDCTPLCQPDCCQPVIVRPPRGCNTYIYQRSCSNLKRPCCHGGGPAACCPLNGGCCNNGCCDTGCCNDGCCHNGCCDTGCCNDGCCHNGCCDTGCCADGCCHDPGCCDDCCDPGCCDECCDPGCCDDVCCDDACGLAELIYESQTACYARQRRRAIRLMSWRYDCVCYPELMCALVYALNDTDERVRAQAANEIGDELRKNPCCCCQKVTCALTCALGDCDWRVRWYAKRALKQCGYKVVDPCYSDCCEVACCPTGCCDTGCCNTGCGNGHSAPSAPSAPADLPAGEAAPVAPQAAPEAPAAPAAAPTPEAAPEPPSAYFPKFYPRHSSVVPAPPRKGLAGLLGLAN